MNRIINTRRRSKRIYNNIRRKGIISDFFQDVSGMSRSGRRARKRKRERDTIGQKIQINQPKRKKHKNDENIKVKIKSFRSFLKVMSFSGQIIPNWNDFNINKNSTWYDLIEKLVLLKCQCIDSSFSIALEMNVPKSGKCIGFNKGLEIDKKIIESLGEISNLILFEVNSLTPMSNFSRLKTIIYLKGKNALPISNVEDLILKKHSGPIDGPFLMWKIKNIILLKFDDGTIKAYNKHKIVNESDYDGLTFISQRNIRNAISKSYDQGIPFIGVKKECFLKKKN